MGNLNSLATGNFFLPKNAILAKKKSQKTKFYFSLTIGFSSAPLSHQLLLCIITYFSSFFSCIFFFIKLGQQACLGQMWARF